MTRYFIGLMLPPPIQNHVVDFVASIQSALPSNFGYRMSWTHPADLHCTLLFIGSYDDEQHLTARMNTVAEQLAPVKLSLEGATHWLGRNSLALGISGADHLGTTFVQKVRDLSSDRWAGRRPFHGHVTIGRVRPVPDADADLLSGRTIEPMSWRADRVQLIRSRVSNSERKYEVVAEAHFGRAVR